jgi:outer membrane receptor protein involved in Fe transport
MNKFRLAWYCAIAMSGVNAVAQQPRPNLGDVSLEELGQIQVFSASQHSQDVRDAPSSVTVITAEEIQKHGYRTLASILDTVREFYITVDRVYSFVGFRGFGRPGDYNSRILLLINGHRMNDNIYDQAMLGTEFPLDVSMIERVEVIRGPGSSLYGSNAFFAVINVVARTASGVSGWRVSAKPSSYGTLQAGISYGGQLKGTDILLSGTASNSSGQTLYFPEFDSPDSNNGISRKLDFDRSRNLFLSAHRGSFAFQAIANWRITGIPTAPWETTFGDRRNLNRDQHQLADLSYKPTWGPWDARIRGYYDRYGYDADWPYPGEQLNVDWARGQMWGTEVEVSRRPSEKHRLTFGAEIRDNFQQDQKNYDVQPAPLLYIDSRESSWLGAFFGQDEIAILAKLTLNAGLRYDHYSRISSALNPRLGLIYRPIESTSIKLLFGSAFRAPTVFEMFYGSDSGSDSNISGYRNNPTLDPEKIQNIEAVWEQDLGSHVRWSTNVFRNNANHLISEITDPESGLLMYVNADRSRATGVGTELGAHSGNGMGGSVAYSFTKAQDPKNDKELVNSPRHLGKIRFDAPIPGPSLTGGFDMRFSGARTSLRGNRVPPFVVANGTLSGLTLKRRLEISSGVYNVFNNAAFDVAPTEDLQDCLRQNGRSFRLTFTWHISGDQ